MKITVKTAHGYLSAQPPNALRPDVRWEYRPYVGEWETFDLDGLSIVLPIPPPDPRRYFTSGDNPREWFMEQVDDQPFAQQTLLDLEPWLKENGWLLTPPNALNQRTKLHPPDGPWVRVGFGEGEWVWVEQP